MLYLALVLCGTESEGQAVPMVLGRVVLGRVIWLLPAAEEQRDGKGLRALGGKFVSRCTAARKAGDSPGTGLL